MRKMVKASTTIEASVIMPLLVIIIVSLVFLALFLHNRLGITQSAYVCAMRGARLEQEDARTVYNEVKQQTREVPRNRTFGLGSYEEMVEVRGRKVYVTMKMSQNNWNFQTTKEAKQLEPVFFIRNCRRAMGLFG